MPPLSRPSAFAGFFLPLAAAALLSLLPARGQVVVSEIHYHPVEEPAFNADGTPALDIGDDVHEFVEIWNTGPVAVDAGGWTLSGGIRYTFPAGTTLPAGGFRVVARNPSRLESVYSLPAGSVLGPWTGKLGNGGDSVRVRNASGESVDEVDYSSSFPWPMSARALGAQDRFTGINPLSYQYKGRSLQRVSATAGSNDPANWLASPLTRGPTPGAAQSITRAVPRPVVVGQSRTQVSDSAAIIRASQQVLVRAIFSSEASLTQVQVEYFLDDVNSTSETRSTVAMTAQGNGIYTATLPGQADRSIVRYRFRANRGDGLETVSPRADDPQIAPTGPSGALEAWHGYFVTPANRTGTTPVYDILMSSAGLSRLSTNITQNPRRVTAANATGLPREQPYVASTAPIWNGTMPAVFANDGEIRDIHLRYHGSQYQRSATARSYKIHFPEHEPYRGITSFFVTDKTVHTTEVQKLMRLLDLPSGLTRTVTLYFNNDAVISRLEHGEFERHVLEEWAGRQAQLNPGAPEPDTGEFYKASGNIMNGSQSNVEGPYTKGDQAPMLANGTWTQLQRYAYTYPIQNNAWKGHKQLQDMVEGMWTARGDSPASNNLTGNSAAIDRVRSWFQANFDMDATLNALAIAQWMGAWDDTGHNQIFWRKADGRWVRLPYDFDSVITSARSTQSIYSNEVGVNTFNGPNWWKDTIFKAFRAEFRQRLWELNNTAFDPVQLTANGLPIASSFASQRQASVNTQVGLGTFQKPARPVHAAPASGTAIAGGALLAGSAYSHPGGSPHARSRWEIRTAAGEYEDPLLRTTSTVHLTSFPVPYDQLTWGQTYFWRVTYYGADNHASIVSAETSFTYGTASTAAGTLVLNEILADNRRAAENAGFFPDYIELRNNGTAPASLTGLSLSDDPLLPARFTFPAGTSIPAGSSLLVWCDDRTTAPGLHTGFGLDADGQTVLLMNGTTIVDSLTFGPQAPDISIGRIVNGTGGWQANVPTPGAVNTARALGSPAGLRINEWMAQPAYGEDWFELFNPGTEPVALSGLYLSDTPGTPTLTKIPPLSYIEAGGFARFMADGSAAGANHANFKLAAGGDSLVLTSADGLTTLDSVTFTAQSPGISAGRLPDGSATLRTLPGTASPGKSNWQQGPLVINEALANSTAPHTDFVELHNPAAAAVDAGGWWLSDDSRQPQKYRIPAGTSVAPGGYLLIPESALAAGTVPFSLGSGGDEIILTAVDGTGTPTGARAQVSFGASLENTSFGRVTTTGADEFWPLTALTPDMVNAAPKTTPVILNEIMYHPPDGAGGTDVTLTEFIEIHNPGTASADLSGWRLKGGSDFTFPAGTSIPPRSYLLVTGFASADAAALSAFRSAYSLADSVQVTGPFAPQLGNATHGVELAMPDGAEWVNVDKAVYADTLPWAAGADGYGSSLQRTSRLVIGNDPGNWGAAAPTPGAVNAGVITELTIVSDSALTGAVIGVPYSLPLAAAGGTEPYAWSLSSGAPPAGLSLDADGLISGTPSAAGVFPFAVRLTDSVPEFREKSVTLTVAAAPLGIATTSIPDGVFGSSFSQTLTASGGNAPYLWSLQTGSLPSGLSVSNAGVISGTAAAHGTFSFTARVDDVGGLSATKSFNLFIPVPPLTILNAAALPGGAMQEAYSQSLSGAGGVLPYVWTVTGGTLPPGLTLSSTGDLSGTPTAVGTYTFTAELADAAAAKVSRAFSLFIAPQPLLITSAETLPSGISGDLFFHALTAQGGTVPLSWTLTAGDLPPGMVLGSSGGLSGTPTQAGRFNFAVSLADSGSQSAQKSFTLAIEPHGALSSFSWDHAPAAAQAGVRFPLRITARDSGGRIVTSFDDTAALAAEIQGPAVSPVLITEITDGGEDQIELQNVTGATVDTTGWYVKINHSLASISTVDAAQIPLPASMPSRGLAWISEASTPPRIWFGSSISWSSTGTSRGWVMLFDSTHRLRDFFVWGWTAANLSSLNVTVNGQTITAAAAGLWTGAPEVVTQAGSTTIWQRTGTSDTDSASDWTAVTANSFNTSNAGLPLPWSTSVPLTLAPATAGFVNGEFMGTAAIAETATGARLKVTSGAFIAQSSAFSITAAPADTDNDGMPDAWETAHGLNPSLADATMDTDGDGSSNLAEFLAGTAPDSPVSVLALTEVSALSQGAISVSWPAVAGKVYRVSTSPDLQAPWTTQPPLVLAASTGTATRSISPAAAGRLFVRVEVIP